MAFSNFKAKQIARTSMRSLFGLLVVTSINVPSIIHAQTGQTLSQSQPIDFRQFDEIEGRLPTAGERGAAAKVSGAEGATTAGPWEAYQKAEGGAN